MQIVWIRTVDRSFQRNFILLRPVQMGKKERESGILVNPRHLVTRLYLTSFSPARHGERQKSYAQRRRDRETERGHKSNMLHCRDRRSKSGTNQSHYFTTAAKETNHLNLISSAACPRRRGSGGGWGWGNWQNKRTTVKDDSSISGDTNREGENGKWWAFYLLDWGVYVGECTHSKLSFFSLHYCCCTSFLWFVGGLIAMRTCKSVRGCHGNLIGRQSCETGVTAWRFSIHCAVD